MNPLLSQTERIMPKRIIDKTTYPIRFKESDPLFPQGKFNNLVSELTGLIPVIRKSMVYVKTNYFLNFVKSELQQRVLVILKMLPQWFVFAHDAFC
jgi:hypothetical protein